MTARLATWWTILRISVEERLVYRGDFVIATFMRFLPIVTQILLWTAVFAAAPRDHIGGFNRDQVIAYYLLVLLSRAMSSMPGLIGNLVEQIRSGEIKKFIIQPIDLISFLLLTRIAHKVVYYIIAAVPFTALFYLCRGYFDGWPDGHTMLAYLAAMVMALLLGFFLELCIGLIGFWWLEVSSLLFVYMLLNFFLSGHMFPLDIVPPPWRQFIDVIPLQYLAYFPAAVFLGKVQGEQLIAGLWTQFAWILFFLLLSRFMLSRGLRRYSGFGG